MSIYKGDKKITGLYKGNAGIIKVYRGTNVVYERQSQDDGHYLTFSSNNPFSMRVGNSTKNWDGTLEYSVDKSNWAEWNGSTVNSAAANGNNFLYFRGKNNTKITGSDNNYGFVISSNSGVSCTGEVWWLLDHQNPESVTPSQYAYCRLFAGCTSLTTTPSLSGITLSNYCYRNMFNGCTSLTSVPELPATVLTEGCYYGMFAGCTSLVNMVALTSTNLANYCYYQMFMGCTKLSKLPLLIASIMPISCYQEMFKNCSNVKLSEIKRGSYWYPYVIGPQSGTVSVFSNALKDMFTGTGGEFTGNGQTQITLYSVAQPV